MPEPGPNAIKAMNYAKLQHAGQRYNDDEPYEVHLENAVAVAFRFGFGGDEEFHTAVCLHDVIEDTRTSYNDVKKRFGVGTAELVIAVTNEVGRNRSERAAKTYPKLRAAGPRAIALKLVDRIANVEYGLGDPNGKVSMYAEEFPGFAEALYVPDSDPRIERMWEALARLLNQVSVLEAVRQRRRAA